MDVLCLDNGLLLGDQEYVACVEVTKQVRETVSEDHDLRFWVILNMHGFGFHVADDAEIVQEAVLVDLVKLHTPKLALDVQSLQSCQEEFDRWICVLVHCKEA